MKNREKRKEGEEAKEGAKEGAISFKRGIVQKYGRKGLLIAAIVLILIGMVQGGFRDIKNKAIRICYECIGIG